MKIPKDQTRPKPKTKRPDQVALGIDKLQKLKEQRTKLGHINHRRYLDLTRDQRRKRAERSIRRKKLKIPYS